MFYRSVSIALVLTFFLTAYAAAPREFKIDNNHSTIGFSVPILGGLSQVKGKFADFDVSLHVDEKDLTRSSVKAVIKTATIKTGIDARDNHLKTADFFDAEKFPEITFQSTTIKKKGKQYVAHGTLTMHGVTKEIDLPFEATGAFKNGGTTTLGYRAHLMLNRRDYGINWEHKTTPGFIGDNIDIDLDVITKATKDQL